MYVLSLTDNFGSQAENFCPHQSSMFRFLFSRFFFGVASCEVCYNAPDHGRCLNMIQTRELKAAIRVELGLSLQNQYRVSNKPHVGSCSELPRKAPIPRKPKTMGPTIATQALQCANPVLADSEGHRAKRAQRGEAHDDANHAEHGMPHLVHQSVQHLEGTNKKRCSEENTQRAHSTSKMQAT